MRSASRNVLTIYASLKRFSDSVSNIDFWSELQRVPIETLVVWADSDLSFIVGFLAQSENVANVILYAADLDVYGIRVDELLQALKGNKTLKVHLGHTHSFN